MVPASEVGDVEGLPRILGYRVSYLPMKYLSLPSGVYLEWHHLKNGTPVGSMEKALFI